MKKLLPLILAILTANFWGGCHSTYSEKKLSEQSPPLLRNSSRIYVAIPFDASF